MKGLVPLQKEKEILELTLSLHPHTEKRPHKDRERRQLSTSQEAGSPQTLDLLTLIMDFPASRT